MSDFSYFIQAMLFNHWKGFALVMLLLIGWSDVFACELIPVIDTTVINCGGCK